MGHIADTTDNSISPRIALSQQVEPRRPPQGWHDLYQRAGNLLGGEVRRETRRYIPGERGWLRGIVDGTESSWPLRAVMQSVLLSQYNATQQGSPCVYQDINRAHLPPPQIERQDLLTLLYEPHIVAITRPLRQET